MMRFFDRVALFNQAIRARAKSYDSPLYNSHPELTVRQPIMRISSDEETMGAGSSPDGYRDYERNTWVRKAANKIADNLAPYLPQVVKGAGMDATPLPNHPLSLLMLNPNKSQDPAALWNVWGLEMPLVGEIGLELVMSAGKTIKEIWLRYAADYTVKPGEFGRRYNRIAHFTIDDGQGKPYQLPPEEFIQFKFHNPLNPWRGLSLISAIRLSIQIDELAQAWSYLFFKNSARPDYALMAPQGLTKDERDEYRLQLMTGHGFPNSHEPIILENGVVDVKPLNFAPKDLEWVSQRELSRDEIAAIFGVPDEIMGYGRDTYENFATAERVFWTLTLMPLIGKRDNTLTHHFRNLGLLKPDERIKTDLANVPALQEDLTGKVAQMQTMFNAGVPMNVINDRLGLGLPNLEGGDVGYLPAALVPVNQIGLTPLPPAAPKTFRVNHKAFPKYGSDEHIKLWEKKQNNLKKPVDEMQRGLKKFLQEQQLMVLKNLRASKVYGRGKYKTTKAPEPSEIFDEEAEAARFEKRFRKDVLDAFNAAVLRELEQLGLEDFPFLDSNPSSVAAVKKILETVAEKTQNTTWLELVDILTQAEKDGLGIQAITELLNDFYEGKKSDWQTERIGRTTMTGADNAGTLEAWEQSGVVKGKTWLSALLPDRTRDEHAAAHGQTVKLDESFEVGGESLAHPGDPRASVGNIANCLCSMTAEL